MEELNNLCTSDDLSLTALREKISQLSTGDVTKKVYKVWPFLHQICMNEKVTLEMVEYILDVFPGVASYQTKTFDYNYEVDEAKTASYALHCACYNKDCPSSIIRLMCEQYTTAIKRLSNMLGGVHEWNIRGLPLHYYLARARNIDIDIVKMLVEEYPQSLMVADYTWLCYPIHALLHNPNITNLHKVIEYLLNVEPASLRVLDGDGNTPLHLACQGQSERANLDVFKLLFNTWPEALRMSSERNSEFPIHELCCNGMLDSTAIYILRFMLSIDSTLARERTDGGYLPIHQAARDKSLEFCKVLIDVYPESVKVRTNIYETLPIHEASVVETFQYLIELYPESINTRDRMGRLPFHYAAQYGRTDIIETLLKHDPDGASKKTTNNARQLPIHLACCNKGIEVVQVLYDAFPEALSVPNGRGRLPISMVRMNEFSNSLAIEDFLETQNRYDQKAKDTTAMHNLDEKDWLPLHHALKDKAPLGSIKLLLKGNPSAIRIADKNMAFPLHIACEFSSAKVVEYLAGESNKYILAHLDENKDSILHYACRGGNLEVIKYLLTNHASLVASAEPNEKGELPIHLLCEAGKDKTDSDNSTECIETIWLMLLANPEAIMS